MAATVTAAALQPVATNHAQDHLQHLSIADQARSLADKGPLNLLIPNGSLANIAVATAEFTRLTGVKCVITEVPVDEMSIELILRANTGDTTIDVSLPATFSLSDLVRANAIEPLDDLVTRFEPEDFAQGYLYRTGDYHHGSLYGYQTDGDVYVLFYNKRMLEDEREQAAYRQLTGTVLHPASSWQQLDQMMRFFHRPEKQQYGGCLFRNTNYLVWEWWARFHAKGYFPLSEELIPNINNAAGVAALDELITASEYQSPNARSNGLFDNWKEFSQDNIFCNIGWGGTQKFLMGQPAMRDNLVHSALPGIANNGPAQMGYFNWGWNYTVSSQSTHKELAYLLILFCTTPHVSTLAVRERDGYFDPFRQEHYEDSQIKEAYGQSFLAAHRQSMQNSIPDFYISGQSSYLDVLREQILAALTGTVSSQRALDLCVQQWNLTTYKIGVNQQKRQWDNLRAQYPQAIRRALLSD